MSQEIFNPSSRANGDITDGLDIGAAWSSLVPETMASNQLELSNRRERCRLQEARPCKAVVLRTHSQWYKLSLHDRRERIAAAKVRSNTKLIAVMFASQDGHCWWCGQKLGKAYHVDHRIAVSRGGTSKLGNLCLSCPHCNTKKHDKTPWEFCGRLL